MWALVFVADFVHLVFKKLIVVTLLIVDYAADKQQYLQDDALERTIESARLVSTLTHDVPNTQKYQGYSARKKVCSCEVVEGLEDEGSVKFAEEEAEPHEPAIDDADTLKG